MTRFWLTLDDAVDLVIAALELEPGEVLIPACRAADMATVAEAVAPGVRVEVIGVRDGEKRHETLLNAHEAPFARSVPGGWALRSLAGERVDELPDGFAYSSDRAIRLTVDQVIALLASMEAPARPRTLAA
jgi:FlaA1/EpsC-like NDP-sugar epimerase